MSSLPPTPLGEAHVFAPATIGNVGPGFDVLGLCVEGIGDIISLKLIAGPSQVGIATGIDADAVPRDPTRNASVLAALAMLRRHNRNEGVIVSVHRKIPLSGGLGSSAAASVGGALAAAFAAGITHTREDLFSAALAGESAVAGTHLDNIAPCVLGGLTLVRPVEPPDVIALPVAPDFWITVVTPNAHLETKTAREVLPIQSPRADWVLQMANTSALVAALIRGDSGLLARSLSDGFAEPRRAHLIPNFFRVKEAALHAGALGCSISGAGPSVFALSDNPVTAEAARVAMEAAFGMSCKLSMIARIAKDGARRASEGGPSP